MSWFGWREAGPSTPDWMNMSGVNEIRSTFLNFFAENGHEIVSSSPLVPRIDPTLMFKNVGMVQYKNVFTGPCGPCSEIFIDRGEHIWGGPPGSPAVDGDRFLEFWNLVFMQYEQVTKEERVALPRPSIDTGMGLERMACIMQGVDSVFETDLFRHLIDATASALGSGPNEQTVASFRVIADHLRSAAFLVAVGVLPSNEGRG